MQALLFASIDGVSKIGYYAGDGNADRALNFGFRPKFFLHKRVDGGGSWSLYDDVRGFNRRLILNSINAQVSAWEFEQSSTGVIIKDTSGYNNSSEVYIYYAHA